MSRSRDPTAKSRRAEATMFRRTGGHRGVATLRDILEIIAIVAAGCWALYVFAYEQRIKPAAEPPSLVFTGSMQRLGEHGGLIQVGFHGTVLNNGHTDVALAALGFAASGVRYAALPSPATDRSITGASIYQHDASIASRTVVYRLVELTRLVSPKYGGGYTLHPGQEVPYSGVFAVRSGKYDSVMLYGSLAYTKFEANGAYPTKVGHAPTGAVIFSSANANPDYNAIEVTLDEISLW